MTPGGVRLEHPEKVLSALQLSAEAQAALLPALTATLPRNSHLACLDGAERAGCGYLPPPRDPGQVEVIYNEGQAALELFVARQWLPATGPVRERYHQPTVGSQNALLHQQTINLGGGSGYQSLSAQGGGAVGVARDSHVGFDWNYNRQEVHGRGTYQRLDINDAYLRHDFARRHYVQLGRMDRRNLSSPVGGNFALGMLPLDRFEGVRFGTTQAYVDQGLATQGSPVTVLLGRNARVDAYDGARLLQSFYLDGGVNDLDTSRFPAGSYVVTLQVIEDGVLVRSEDVPFNKNGSNWADQSLQWFVQGGRIVTEDMRDHDSSLQAGVRVPLHRDLAATAGAAVVDGVGYVEARLDLQKSIGGHEFSGSSAILRGADGGHGVQSQASYRRHVSVNLFQQRMRGGACSGQTYTAESLGCLDSLSGSMSAPLAGGTVYLGYTRRTTFAPRYSNTMPPWLEQPWNTVPPILELEGERRLTRSLQASFSRSFQWHGFNLASRVGVFRQRSTGNGGSGRDNGAYLNISVTRLVREPAMSRQDRYGVDLQGGRGAPQALTWRAGQVRRWETESGFRELGGELNGGNQHRQGALASVRMQDSMGTHAATISRFRGPGRGEMSYSATHTSSFAWGRSGLYWGSDSGSGAGVGVEVESPEDVSLHGVAAEVRVSGARRHLLHFGDRRLLPLAAYAATRTEVQDVSSHEVAASVHVDGQGVGSSVFLPPGRMMIMPIGIDLTYTFIGNALDSNGVALDGARILNAPLPSLGRDGGFVADFPQREKTLYLLQSSHLLECPLQVREKRAVVFLVGAVRCRPLAVDRLPMKIHQQARVQRLLNEQNLSNAVPAVAGGGDVR
ncbi:usher protein [Stenotrophomonas sp. HMWF023]|nr:usher protein [Stenotrophomonas sp. HMWF023]